MVPVDGVGEARGIEDADVRAVANAEPARVETEPLGELAGESVHRLLGRREGPAGLVGLMDDLQDANGEVVEGHVSEVGPGIGEAELQVRISDHLLDGGLAVVGDGRPPAHPCAVLHDEVEEEIGGVQVALGGDVAEGSSDEGGLRACCDLGIMEVAMPHPCAPALVAVLAEASPVLRILQKLGALQDVGDVEGGLACTELLEDDEVHAVRVDLEGRGYALEAGVGTEPPVREAQESVQQAEEPWVGLGVGCCDQRCLERRTEAPEALPHVEEEVVLRRQVGGAL